MPISAWTIRKWRLDLVLLFSLAADETPGHFDLMKRAQGMFAYNGRVSNNHPRPPGVV